MEEEPATVLVVDDDASIRLLCRVNLELEGYRVLEAGTLAEGRLAASDDAVRVALLDVHLGADDGRDLLRELRARRPDVHVALLSGSARREQIAREEADALIPKPFVLEELIETVARLASTERRESVR
ncbi:MAG: response regulator [Actinomycetota bacterium]|nr:response regulator [Actinomycetota bacterium]